MVERIIEKIKSRKMADILRVQSCAVSSMVDYLLGRGFVQLPPVILSPITDPLAHPVHESSITYLGTKLELTKSMILHKQIALCSPHLDKIFIVSPNVRLERAEDGAKGRYLIEFSQVDIEMKGLKGKEFREVMEGMVVGAIEEVNGECKGELERLGRDIEVPKSPFSVYESKEVFGKGEEEGLKELYEKEKQPFWVLDFKREFYDREDDGRKGYYHNYDLYLPGFGEVLSGAERDYEYGKLVRKIKERKQKEESFGAYMELAKKKMIVPTTGGGIGVERFVRYLCGLGHIREVGPFAKVPGEEIVL